MKLSVVIPTNNGRRFLGPCLEALARTQLPSGAQLETIVVDSGSSDGTERLLARHPEVKVVKFSSSVGFARANNAARGVATGSILCFLNNDTQVEPDWIVRPLEIFARDERVVGIGSKLLFMHRYIPLRFSLPIETRLRIGRTIYRRSLDQKIQWSGDVREAWVQDASKVYVPLPVPNLDEGCAGTPAVQLLEVAGKLEGSTVTDSNRVSHCITRLPAIVLVDRKAPTVRLIQNAGSWIDERYEAGDVGSGEEDQDSRYMTEEIVPALCGAAFFVRRDAVDAVGWWPDYYQFYCEDIDLSLRLRDMGGLLVFCPSSVVNHYHAASNREHSAHFVENVARSSLLFASRYATLRVFARKTADHLRRSRNEFIAGRGSTAAAEARGVLRAMSALHRTLGSRMVSSSREGADPSLISVRRRPYLSIA